MLTEDGGGKVVRGIVSVVVVFLYISTALSFHPPIIPSYPLSLACPSANMMISIVSNYIYYFPSFQTTNRMERGRGGE